MATKMAPKQKGGGIQKERIVFQAIHFQVRKLYVSFMERNMNTTRWAPYAL